MNSYTLKMLLHLGESIGEIHRSDGPVVERLPHNRKAVGSSPGRVIPKTLKVVLTAFSSGTRHMRMEWKVKLAKLPAVQPPAVAFTAFADSWPRGRETEIGATVYTIGRGKGL